MLNRRVVVLGVTSLCALLLPDRMGSGFAQQTAASTPGYYVEGVLTYDPFDEDGGSLGGHEFNYKAWVAGEVWRVSLVRTERDDSATDGMQATFHGGALAIEVAELSETGALQLAVVGVSPLADPYVGDEALGVVWFVYASQFAHDADRAVLPFWIPWLMDPSAYCYDVQCERSESSPCLPLAATVHFDASLIDSVPARFSARTGKSMSAQQFADIRSFSEFCVVEAGSRFEAATLQVKDTRSIQGGELPQTFSYQRWFIGRRDGRRVAVRMEGTATVVSVLDELPEDFTTFMAEPISSEGANVYDSRFTHRALDVTGIHYKEPGRWIRSVDDPDLQRVFSEAKWSAIRNLVFPVLGKILIILIVISPVLLCALRHLRKKPA